MPQDCRVARAVDDEETVTRFCDALKVGENTQVAVVPGRRCVHTRILVTHADFEVGHQIDAVSRSDGLRIVQFEQGLPQGLFDLLPVFVGKTG